MLNHREDCRVCHGKDVVRFLSLGNVPLAGGFIKEEQIPQEQKFPLDVYFCRACSLVQIMDIVPPEILFMDYRYLSSVTKTLREHFERHARELVSEYGLGGDSLAVEIGCNDGVLLKPLEDLGVKGIGFEPAENIAKVAKAKGLEVITDFFSERTAEKLRSEKGNADMLLANNVFAHIDDIDDIMKGIQTLLKDDGVFVFEVHYIVDLIEKVQYDTIYHEHLCYYSVKALQALMNRYGMQITRVKRIPIHSGSISVHAKKIGKNNVDRSVADLIRLEESLGLHDEKGYRKFAENVERKKKELAGLIKKLKYENKKIIAYGAPGRGTILLNYCNLGKDLIDYVVDESPERYGRVMPGVHIPIFQPKRLREDRERPDYILILAWSYFEEITKKEKWFADEGGKFIMPLPEVKVV